MISHSLYRLLSIKYHSQVQIDVIVSKRCEPLVKQLSEVNKTFILPYSHKNFKLAKSYHLGQLLKQKKYQQAIILPNSFKSALIPWIANIPKRTGWRGEMRYGLLNDLRILNTLAFPLMVHRYAALAYNYSTVKNFLNLPNPLPLPKLHTKQKETIEIIKKFNLKTKNIITLCPGSESSIKKCWPYYHYIDLAIKLINLKYHIVILGSSKENPIKYFIEHSTLQKFKQHYHNLIGKTSLNEAIAILSICKGVVSNDSGLMHIACALNQPAVLGLYGSLSNPNCTPPLSSNSKIIFNNNTNNNYYKYQKIRKYEETYFKYNYHNSLINITPNQVLKKLQELLL